MSDIVTYTCGHCGTEVEDGKKCFCQIDFTSEANSSVEPMTFRPVDHGCCITFDNGWTVSAVKAAEDIPGKVVVKAFMPQGFQIRAYGRDEIVVNCNDLAVILIQTSQIEKGIAVSEDCATQSYEAMLEGLTFGVAA